jgi:hypothetical protein
MSAFVFWFFVANEGKDMHFVGKERERKDMHFVGTERKTAMLELAKRASET